MASPMADPTMNRLLDGRTNGSPIAVKPLGLTQLGSAGWNVLAADLPLPRGVLKDTALRHNSAWMRVFREMTGVALVPRGKTSMSLQLFQRQFASDPAFEFYDDEFLIFYPFSIFMLPSA